MKKAVFVFTVLIAIFIAGCNQRNLVKNISGDWHVQKYVVDGKDQTHWFDTTYSGFKWKFTEDRTYLKTWSTRRVGSVSTSDTISHYDSTTMTTVIDSVNTTSAIVPYTYQYMVNGRWVLTNGNKYLIAEDSIANTQYEIVNHSNSSLHLYSGNEDYYLAQ